MARDPNIEEEVKFYTDILIKIYKETDPSLGENSEEFKLERARHAINVWWKLYSRLMAWAQSQILGFAICSEEPEFRKRIESIVKHDLTVDSHDLEHIGMQWIANRAPNESETLEKYDQILEAEFGELADMVYFKTHTMRKFIDEILMSTSVDSSFWRMELQHSLRALNEGEVDELSAPSPLKKQGQPYSLKAWKYHAVIQVCYRVGKGMKKYRALEQVADGIGQSPETIRSWQKELSTEHDYFFDFRCAEIAGFHEKDFEESSTSEIYDYIDELGFNRGADPLEMASFLLRIIKNTSFEIIKDNLRKYRSK